MRTIIAAHWKRGETCKTEQDREYQDPQLSHWRVRQLSLTISHMPTPNLLPHQFQQHSLSLINSLLPLSDAVFFLLEPNMQHSAAVIFKGEQVMESQYTKGFAHMDPLHPERFRDSEARVVTLDSQIAPHLLKQSRYYQEFMQVHQHRYVADMFFRREGQIVAVLSALRAEPMGDFDSTELALLDKVQPFIEYSLNTVYLPQRQYQRSGFVTRYQLTDRELDVLELLLRGAQNKEIAKHLGISLATVKTHIQHLFAKTQSSNRSELIGRALQQL
ncbi:MAG: response regulator transcription factor [Pseudomonadales bacterium]